MTTWGGASERRHVCARAAGCQVCRRHHHGPGVCSSQRLRCFLRPCTRGSRLTRVAPVQWRAEFVFDRALEDGERQQVTDDGPAKACWRRQGRAHEKTPSRVNTNARSRAPAPACTRPACACARIRHIPARTTHRAKTHGRWWLYRPMCPSSCAPCTGRVMTSRER